MVKIQNTEYSGVRVSCFVCLGYSVGGLVRSQISFERIMDLWEFESRVNSLETLDLPQKTKDGLRVGRSGQRLCTISLATRLHEIV